MSFENTPQQSTDIVKDAPFKKRGRPAGAKNKKPVAKKTIGRPVSNPSRLKADLESAKNLIFGLKVALDDSRERHKTEVDGLMAIISYLENTLKEAWKDAASV
jgi:hypothetical protein